MHGETLKLEIPNFFAEFLGLNNEGGWQLPQQYLP